MRNTRHLPRDLAVCFAPELPGWIQNSKRWPSPAREKPHDTTYELHESHGGVPIKTWTRGVPVEPEALDQLTNIARLPIVHKWVAEDHKRATQGVECRKDKDVIDETPGAYKDIDKVMAAQSELVEAVHTLKQVVCVKG